MARSTTSSFITEVPLLVDSKQEAELLSRFQAGRQLYNACLNEAIKRLELVRNSELYNAARKIPRTKKKERTEAFKKAREQYRYSEYDLHSFASITSKNAKWIAEKVDATAQQKLATRAFKASERVMLGMAQNVRYKVPNRFRSVEGKSNKQGLRWRNDCLVWGKLILKPIIDRVNPVIRHGLESPVKYVRLLWRVLNRKRRWYAQLVNEGLLKFQLFTQVKLSQDFPEYALKKGAVGTIVEYYPMPEGQEDGYSLEGLVPQDTVEVCESQIESIAASVSQVRFR